MKPNPIILLGALFVVGIGALLIWSSHIVENPSYFEHFNSSGSALIGCAVFYGAVALIPGSVFAAWLNIDRPSISLAAIAFAQIAILILFPTLIHLYLRRFSSLISYTGTTLAYMVFCFATNSLIFINAAKLFPATSQ